MMTIRYKVGYLINMDYPQKSGVSRTSPSAMHDMPVGCSEIPNISKLPSHASLVRTPTRGIPLCTVYISKRKQNRDFDITSTSNSPRSPSVSCPAAGSLVARAERTPCPLCNLKARMTGFVLVLVFPAPRSRLLRREGALSALKRASCALRRRA